MSDQEIQFVCERINEEQSLLITGNYPLALEFGKQVFSRVQLEGRYLCTWHDASLIRTPLDFFEPVLKLKYGSQYETLKRQLEDLRRRNIFELARFCGSDSEFHDGKMPLIFIDRIEELFFNLDYGPLDDRVKQKLLNSDFLEQPISQGFGNALRAHLHQEQRGLFFGIVRNTESFEFLATLGNYHYLFYEENFCPHRVWEEQTLEFNEVLQ
jgi:hypothetical protein